MAFVYVLFVLLKIEGVAPKRLRPGVFRGWWRTLALRTSVIGVFALLYVYYAQPDMLFSPLNNAPSTWLKFLVIYTVFSVWPQELVYRTFFYSRYRELFGSEAVFVFLNAVLFALAHLFFRNVFVLLITFAGGLLFAQTYNRYRSTVLEIGRAHV